MHAGEEQLISRAVAGDVAALTSLLETHGPRTAGTLDISPKWRTHVTPEDVMQVTYLEAFVRITDFVSAGPGSFGAWLRRIAANNLRDAIKELERAKRPHPDRRISTHQESCVELINLLSAGGATPSGITARAEAVSFLDSALARLPDDYQRVIRLHELEGRPVRAVAEHIGRSEGAVKMLLARAREHLREALGSRSRFLSS